jgi:hypothetical protein
MRIALASFILFAAVSVSAQPSASQPTKVVASAPASAPVKLVAATHPPVVPVAATTQPLGKVAGVDDMSGVTGTITKAIDTSNWRVVATAALLFLIWVLRAIGAKFWKFIGTDRGGALLALISGVLVALINGWASGKTFSITWVIQGIEMGVSAAGGWVVAKRLISPTDKKEEKAAADLAAATPPSPPAT